MMYRDASVLVEALRDPASVAGLSDAQWTELLSIARAEALAGTLAEQVKEQHLPAHIALLLAEIRDGAKQAHIHALWEAEMARRALAPQGIRTILLKGTAYAAAELTAAAGRQIGDLDILVPRNRLADAENALLGAGWEWVKDDAYDDAYYRRWMHELPPLIHSERDRMIDVHHTILPLTARVTPDAEAMVADAIAIAANATTPGPGSVDSLYMLSAEDRICHSAAHLFADGDLQGGLRNLWDLHRLLEADAMTPGFWNMLRARAARHGLTHAVLLAARLAHDLYDTSVPGEWLGPVNTHYRTRLLARNGWGQETHKLLRCAFYIRSHLLRMPPHMLARHLWTKGRKQLFASR